MKRQTAKQCQQCGKPYVGGNASKFCGDACRKLARPDSYYRPQLTCLQCGRKYKGRADRIFFYNIAGTPFADDARQRELIAAVSSS